MKIVGVKTTSKGTVINCIEQNANDEKSFGHDYTFPDTEPKGILKALKKLIPEAKSIAGLDGTSIIDIKGISLKHRENQVGLNISVFHHVNDGSELGFAFSTPFKYDVHENPDFTLPEGIMKKINDVRNEAVKYIQLHKDQMELKDGA